jgi:hypothetical protein
MKEKQTMKKSINRAYGFKAICLLMALALYSATVIFSKSATTSATTGASAPVPAPAAVEQPTPTPACPPIRPGGAFADNNGMIPPHYTGEHFVMSDKYPDTPPPKPAAPWNKALDGPFPTPDTLEAYMLALRDYPYKALSPVDWRANKLKVGPHGRNGWYDAPWLGRSYETCQLGGRMAVPWPGQDYIRGTYYGTPLNAGTMPDQTCSYDNYETVYYNDVAAYFLGQVWKGGTLHPTNFQFPEGTVITKLVFTTAPNTGVLAGAPQWQIYVAPPCPSSSTACNPQTKCPSKPKLTTVTLIQMDIVLKDTQHAPQTGWVFTTYVYDPDFNPSGPNNPYGGFDHMMPLGLMWGNDPGVTPGNPLKETVLNGDPNMPAWFRTNLGWGERLSGPIDGAKGVGSCLGCHSSSEYTLNPKQPLETFGRMVPPVKVPPLTDQQKMRWFRNLAGDEPWSSRKGGWKGLDYSFVMLGAITHYYASRGIKLNNNVLNERARPSVTGVAPHGLSSGGNQPAGNQ